MRDAQLEAIKVAGKAQRVNQGNDTISTYDLARWADTIAYEITCGISDRVPRQYIGMPA